jgi:hypothetical protein
MMTQHWEWPEDVGGTGRSSEPSDMLDARDPFADHDESCAIWSLAERDGVPQGCDCHCSVSADAKDRVSPRMKEPGWQRGADRWAPTREDTDALIERLRAAYHYYACPHHGKWHAELCILALRALEKGD